MQLVALTLLLAAPASARPTTLNIKVVDSSGDIVPTATVVAPQESALHHVNTNEGTFMTEVLYLSDGSELVIERDTALELVVSAPGYEAVKLTTLPHKRGKPIEVTLTTPIEAPELSCAADISPALGTDHAGFLVASAAALNTAEGAEAITCLHQARAWSAYLELQKAAKAHATEPTSDTFSAYESARLQSTTLIEQWQSIAEANGLDAKPAATLCLSASGGLASATCTP